MGSPPCVPVFKRKWHFGETPGGCPGLPHHGRTYPNLVYSMSLRGFSGEACGTSFKGLATPAAGAPFGVRSYLQGRRVKLLNFQIASFCMRKTIRDVADGVRRSHNPRISENRGSDMGIFKSLKIFLCEFDAHSCTLVGQIQRLQFLVKLP